MGSRDSLLVRAPDSWSKGCKFESRQEQQENFLLQSQLCVLTLIWCPFHPCVTAVARKRPHYSAKSAGGRLHLNTHTPWTHGSQSGLTRCPGRVWESIRKRAHTQLIREHLVTVISARWATVDWSWPKEWNYWVRPNLHLKKKKRKEKKKRRQGMNCRTFSQNPRKEKATTNLWLGIEGLSTCWDCTVLRLLHCMCSVVFLLRLYVEYKK